MMPSDLWTNSDPAVATSTPSWRGIDPRYVETLSGDPDARLRILVSVEGDDAERLERIADARGQKPGDVVVELLCDADRSVA